MLSSVAALHRMVQILSVNLLCLVLVLPFAAFTPACAQRLTWLGTLGGAESQAEAVSNDGSIVVGWSKNAAGVTRAFRWTVASGMRDLGALITWGQEGIWSIAYDISGDGATIVGTSMTWHDGPLGAETYQGFAWTNGFMRALGAPNYYDLFGGYPEWLWGWSQAFALSSNGSVIVGYEQEPERWITSGPWFAVRWLNGSVQRLSMAGIALDVSADGAIIVGRQFGQPCAWYDGGINFLSNSNMDGKPVFGWAPYPESNSAYAVSADGRIAVGKGYRDERYSRAVRWFIRENFCEDLGTLGGNQACALDVSANGAVIVGWAENSRGQVRAFYSLGGVMVDLNLLCEHVLYPGSYLRVATGISADGRYIVGQGYNAETRRFEAFLLDVRGLSVPSPPTNLRAFALSSTQIQLDWKDNSMGEQGFEIERKGESGDYTVIARVGANVTTYTDGGLTRDTTYTYRVRAYNASGKSPYSNPASATTCSGNGLLHEERHLYRANLHSHSSYSDGRWSLTVEGDLPPAWVFTWAYNMNWNIWAVTDHAEQLSEQEWQKTEQDALTSMSWFPTFAALRGFEWTGYTDDMLNPFDTPVDIGGGHINVFGSDRRKGAYEASDKKKYPIEPFDVLPNLLSLYDWLANTPATDGGTLVAQFNHPTTYDESSHFQRFWAPGFLGLNAPLVKVFALMEMGSYTAPWQSFSYEGGEENLITGVARDDQARSNEYWFRVALFQGWHVAPANNRDNHLYKPDLLGEPSGPPAFTGIWAPSFGGGGYLPEQRTSMILDALRSRRVFASEDWNTQLTFQARIKRGNTVQRGWYWMGSTFEIPVDANAVEAEIRIVKDDSTPHDCVAVVELFISPPWDCAEPDRKYLTYRWIRSYAPVSAPMTQLVEARFTIPIAQLRSQRRNALGEVYMYVRVRTSSGRLLYSAPIWIRGVPADMSSPLDKEPL